MIEVFYNCDKLQCIKANNIGCNETIKTDRLFDGSSKLGLDDEGETINRQSLVDTLLTNSFDRATAGYSALTINLHKDVLDRLTDEEKAQITAKGFTLAS